MYSLVLIGVSGPFRVIDPPSEGAVAEIERFATLVPSKLLITGACLGRLTPQAPLMPGVKLRIAHAEVKQTTELAGVSVGVAPATRRRRGRNRYWIISGV